MMLTFSWFQICIYKTLIFLTHTHLSLKFPGHLNINVLYFIYKLIYNLLQSLITHSFPIPMRLQVIFLLIIFFFLFNFFLPICKEIYLFIYLIFTFCLPTACKITPALNKHFLSADRVVAAT